MNENSRIKLFCFVFCFLFLFLFFFWGGGGGGGRPQPSFQIVLKIFSLKMFMQNKNYTQKILFRQQKYPTSLKFNHKGYQEKVLFHKDLDVESYRW